LNIHVYLILYIPQDRPDITKPPRYPKNLLKPPRNPQDLSISQKSPKSPRHLQNLPDTPKTPQISETSPNPPKNPLNLLKSPRNPTPSREFPYIPNHILKLLCYPIHSHISQPPSHTSTRVPPKGYDKIEILGRRFKKRKFNKFPFLVPVTFNLKKNFRMIKLKKERQLLPAN